MPDEEIANQELTPIDIIASQVDVVIYVSEVDGSMLTSDLQELRDKTLIRAFELINKAQLELLRQLKKT